MKYGIKKWVEEVGGIKEAAALLGVKTHSVRVWLRGQGTPRVKTILEMEALSQGRLTFRRIAEDSTRNQPGTAKSC